jgi:hypothetical protein
VTAATAAASRSYSPATSAVAGCAGPLSFGTLAAGSVLVSFNAFPDYISSQHLLIFYIKEETKNEP